MYVSCVVALGSAAVVYSLYDLNAHPVSLWWFGLLGVTLVSGSVPVKVASIPATISASETLVFTAVLFFGASAGTITVALEGLIISLRLQRRKAEEKRPEGYKAFFSMAAGSLSMWIAATLWTDGGSALGTAGPSLLTILPPLFLLPLTYFAINSALIAFAIALETSQSAFGFWRRNLLWLSVTYFGGASVAVLLVLNSRGHLDPLRAAVIIPLLVTSYLTNKYSMGRLEDARKLADNAHKLAENSQRLATFYEKTTETLAAAIDINDEVTSGHVRRVKNNAMRLAMALRSVHYGQISEDQLEAIKAAALLHDTGKLGVPQYILNKPGRLTPAEFERMKSHATSGANILSQIDFPYPVVPIVRHHHENWDGSGYPDGLKGPEIEIGARILSVVDCFDALTSDRPYRPKLSDTDALRILTERRGTFYDPFVVDMFLRLYEDDGFENYDVPAVSNSEAPKLSEPVSPSAQTEETSIVQDGVTTSEEVLTLYELGNALRGQTSLADAGDIIAKHLRRVVPSSLCVFYLYDVATDELVAAHVTPDALPLIGLRIRVGERIAGWVAANRRSIVNSDPRLDFGEIARSSAIRLRSCLSTPLVADDALIGVLTLCSPNAATFSEDHRRMIEAIARQISRVVRDAVNYEREHSRYRDALTGLPNSARLLRLTPSDIGMSGHNSSPRLSLAFLDFHQVRQVIEKYGRDAGDAVLTHIAQAMRQGLRGTDILFRYDESEFIVLLAQTNRELGQTIADRLLAALAGSPCSLPDGRLLPIVVSLGLATYPDDSDSLTGLISVAQNRVLPTAPVTGNTGTQVH